MGWSRSDEYARSARRDLGALLTRIRLRTPIKQNQVGAKDPDEPSSLYGKVERAKQKGFKARTLVAFLRQIRATPEEEWTARFLLAASKCDDEVVQQELIRLAGEISLAKARAAPGGKQ